MLQGITLDKSSKKKKKPEKIPDHFLQYTVSLVYVWVYMRVTSFFFWNFLSKKSYFLGLGDEPNFFPHLQFFFEEHITLQNEYFEFVF